MTHRPLRQTQIDPADVLDCGSAIRLLGRDDYIVRDHVFEVDARPHRLVETLGLWRRRYLTRRHLAALDGHGLADIGLDRAARDREVAQPFRKL